MKKRISATIDEKTERVLKKLLRGGEFRNKSHVIEKAIELLEKEKNGKNKK